ncbi:MULTISPECIES: ankyrin repeat domain-containing protein [unclassified Beijerinckia]|uniref:ankyrin repeat domain-containing protein n=1 Tax=unclassified Beijerinckia TaxID=2638183 RepID=UPI000896A567|nr:MULTISPECIES: ankyrin repeat domain-containing protein [unclassified Beijerinckia]MDH7794452.1 ankyrin repeat protein [Beijerinckia sp. GAS462]SEB62712.1 hypothetical protein SAMN05443249_0723 [Beijerinckia sp. 28-YEA-48]
MKFVIAFLSVLFAQAVMAQPVSTQRLHEAVTRGDTKAIAAALDSGTAVDAVDRNGQTALLLAVAAGKTEAARLLLQRGANVNAQAANQDTPWLLAGALGRTAILELMLSHKPDLSLRNRFGGSALIPACERGHVETIRLLTTKSGIDVNHVNNLGWTCLLEIVILGDGGPRHVEATRLVVAAGANVNLADRDGVTPLTHAQRRGQTVVAQVLAAAGAK